MCKDALRITDILEDETQGRAQVRGRCSLNDSCIVLSFLELSYQTTTITYSAMTSVSTCLTLLGLVHIFNGSLGPTFNLSSSHPAFPLALPFGITMAWSPDSESQYHLNTPHSSGLAQMSPQLDPLAIHTPTTYAHRQPSLAPFPASSISKVLITCNICTFLFICLLCIFTYLFILSTSFY